MSGNGGKDNEKDLFAPIGDAIQEIMDGLDDNLFIEFVGSFVVFDEKKLKEDADDVIHDARMFAYGIKDSLIAGLEGLI